MNLSSHRFLAVFVLVSSLAGCNHATSTSSGDAASAAQQMPDQSQLCEVHKWQEDVTSAACRVGQKIVFLPSSWGSDQLPILFAAVNCDLRFSVALTNGGVTCIYAGPFAPTAKADAAPAKSSSAGSVKSPG